MLKAIGKYIDTLPLARLFSQEEDNVDTVVIEVDRFYGAYDLSDFTFIMRGITKSGGETETELEKEVLDTVLHLKWNVSSLFTAEAGTLFLDLLAYCYQNAEADRTQTTPDYLLRYQLPSVEVRGFPDNTHTLEGQSYSDMLAQIREVFASASAMQTTVNTHDTMIRVLSATVSADHEQLIEIPAIAVMTQAQYNALENPDESTLYILT